MRDRTVVQFLASAIQARLNCIQSNNGLWEQRHELWAEYLVENHLPSGSGVDSGCQIDFDKSTGEKLVITTSFNHMDESGMYDGWTDHVVTVRPSFDGFDIRISGRNRNDIKEYLSELFHNDLSAPITHEYHTKMCQELFGTGDPVQPGNDPIAECGLEPLAHDHIPAD